MKKTNIQLVGLIAALSASGLVVAHTGDQSAATGFWSGLTHPLSGLDHLLALMAVGLWAGTARRQAMTTVAGFAGFAAVGAALASAGLLLPWMETGIAASLLVAGLLAARISRLGAVTALALVGLFALFHGQAHVVQMPETALPVLYGAGFVAASLAVMLVSRQAGDWLTRHAYPGAIRRIGWVTVAVGAWMLGTA